MTTLDESSNPKFELGAEDQKPRNIALATFRFRARRGIGVYYSLLSTVPILVGVLINLSAPSYLVLISTGLLVLGILSLASLAGMKRFYQMRSVMSLLERDQEERRSSIGRYLESARIVLVTLLPLVAAAIFAITGNAVLGSLVLVAFVAYVVAYWFSSRQSANSVIPWRMEDWLVTLFTPALLLLYFFQLIGTTTYLISLILLFLLAGIKSSYEAPQALVQVLSEREGFGEPSTSSKRDDVNLAELASGGALSSLTKIGIMLALLGVEQLTFTDLMFVVKVSKSSLNHSVNALEEARYVTIHKGFKTIGGPRTFIEITKQGKKAIRTHLENMQTLASKFLC